MDEFVRNILTQWKLESFVDRFSKAGIDEEIFKIIDENLINELFERLECGFKKKFKTKFEEWKNQEVVEEENSTKVPEPKVTNNENFIEKDVEKNVQNLSVLQISHENSFSVNDSSLSMEFDKDLNASNDSNAVFSYIPALRKSVKELLMTTTQGKLIYQMFKMKTIIDTRLICNLLINYEFDFTGSYRISKERFVQLSEELGAIFANENKSAKEVAKTFYYPFTRSTKSCKSVNTGGALYEKYTNYRQKLIQFGIIKKNDSDSGISLVGTPQEVTINWLQENDSPEEDVIQCWKDTFCFRDPCKNLLNYLTQYKCLRSSFGHVLLELDFDATYPTSANSLENDWDTVAPLIISIAKEKKKLIDIDNQLIQAGRQDIAALLCLPRLLGILIRKRKNSEIFFGNCIKDVLDSFILIVKSKEELVDFKKKREEFSAAMGSKILPYVVFVGNLEKEGEVQAEVQSEVESEVQSEIQPEVESEVESEIQSKIQSEVESEVESENEKQENSRTETYVVINNIDYRIKDNKIIKAVSACFKCMLTLRLEFPHECKHVWTFLQEFIYKIELNNSKPYTSVKKLISDLNALKQKEKENEKENSMNVLN